MFGSKPFTLAATGIFDRNTGQQIYKQKVLTGDMEGFGYIQSRDRGEEFHFIREETVPQQFWILKVSVGQLETLLQMQAHHLRRKSSNYLQGCCFYPLCLVWQTKLGADQGVRTVSQSGVSLLSIQITWTHCHSQRQCGQFGNFLSLDVATFQTPLAN